MTQRATVRPPHVRPPAHLTPSPPVPAAEPLPPQPAAEAGGPKGLEPVRYGDWESKGMAIDF